MTTYVSSDGFPATSVLNKANDRSAYTQHFNWLCRSWAIAGVFHFLSFHDWRWQGLSGAILIALALIVIRRPQPITFALFLGTDIYAVSSRMGLIPNHILFSLLMNVVMLGVLCAAHLRGMRTVGDDTRAYWITTVAPLMRMSVAILYFFTVFHKINRAYFNPDVSCASSMLHEIGALYAIIPNSIVADNLAIYGTLVMEGLIPILMFIPRTRLAGGVLALGFHAILSLHPHPGIYSFTATIVSLLSWFIPSGFFVNIQPRAKMLTVLRIIWLFVCLFVASALLIGVMPSLERFFVSAGTIGFSLGYYGLLIYVAAIGVAFVRIGLRAQPALTAPLISSESLLQKILYRCPLCALLVLIGMQPYLGLRTRMCFSMFSNLQTEGGVGNHLLIPDALQQTRWQQELVSVIASEDPGLNMIANRNHRIPVLELSRRIRESKAGYSTTFRYMGKEHTCLSGDVLSMNVLPELSPLGERYLYFRSVGQDPATVPCQW
ncbi:MAG: hypothetical protein ACOVP2_11475 [Armatimonadaceae bacterium]